MSVSNRLPLSEIFFQQIHRETSDLDNLRVPPNALVECLRHALIRTTVNSMAGNNDPELIARAVEIGL